MSTKTLWELLWDYDPNGLVVVDRDTFNIRIVNPAFGRMFKKETSDIIGRHISEMLDNIADFERVRDKNIVIRAKEKEYPEYDLFVKYVLFPIEDEQIIACIMVDITHEIGQRQEMQRMKEETIAKVNNVVDKQMQVAQEIAQLLGEATAETKVSLIRLVEMLKKEN